VIKEEADKTIQQHAKTFEDVHRKDMAFIKEQYD
jgi:hypothetical protein